MKIAVTPSLWERQHPNAPVPRCPRCCYPLDIGRALFTRHGHDEWTCGGCGWHGLLADMEEPTP